MKPTEVVKQFVQENMRDVEHVIVIYQQKDGIVGMRHDTMSFVESFGIMSIAHQLLADDLREHD